MRKAICFILCLVLLIVCYPFQASAEKNYDYVFQDPETQDLLFSKILTDNSSLKKVKVWNNEMCIISIFDKNTSTIQVTTTDSKDCVIDSLKISLKDLSRRNTIDAIFSAYDDSGQYGYTHRTDINFWSIKAAGITKLTYQGSTNVNELRSFRDCVLDLKGAQVKLESVVGAEILAAIIALLVAPTGWSQVLAMLLVMGIVITSQGLYYDVWRYAEDCRYYFNQVKVIPGVRPYKIPLEKTYVF